MIAQDWSINGLSVELKMDRRTVAKIIDESDVESAGNKGNYKTYRMAAVVNAMLGSDELDLQQERAKLAVEQTRRLQLKNDQEEGRLAPVSILGDALNNATGQIASVLDALPLTLKKRCPMLTGREIEIIQKEIARCRNAAADAVISSEGSSD
jgi:phage terminase Nu1 subunit (DNA packaging protein)